MDERRVLAGAATADITPGVGVAMGGYGARAGVAEGLNDPLLARVLAMTDAHGTTLVMVVCDLVGVSYGLVQRARALIEDDLGVPADNVLVAATHTHSGPAAVTARQSADYVATTVRAVAGAARAAIDSQQEARLKVGSANVTSIAQNRREPAGPTETEARILFVEPVATLVNYACHATVFEHDNLHWSADFPGAMARAVEAAVGGTAIYLQGAAGDVNPVWMRHDAAEVERVGGILGAATAKAVHELAPVGAGQWCVNLSWSEEVPVPPAPHGSLVGDVRFAARRATLTVPVRPRVDAGEARAELADLAAAIEATGDVSARRRLVARRNELAVQLQVADAASEARREHERLELQAFRFGDGVALASLPGEFFVETGSALRARSRLQHLFVAGYANGMVGYVPPAGAFPAGGYEVGMARFGPDTAAAVVDRSLALLGEVAG